MLPFPCLVLCCVPLSQSSTLTRAMQIAEVQSLDFMAECMGSFLHCRIVFFLNEVFSSVGVFPPEDGVGPPPKNKTHLAPATDCYTCTCHISMQSLLLCLDVMYKLVVMYVRVLCCAQSTNTNDKCCHCGHLA